MITPFRESQQEARDIIESEGKFVLIYVNCSVEAAVERDPKNLYEQAREGHIENFTGINHPFQEPHSPDIVVDAESQTPGDCVAHILRRIEKLGVIDNEADSNYSFDLSRTEESEIKEHLSDLGYLNK
jgi:adenylylsulfate kinase